MKDKEIQQKTFIGTAVTPVRNKTVVVEIERLKKHKLYDKNYKVNKRIKARCEISGVDEGARVKIVECRPLSKEVSFRVISVEN